MTAPIPGYVLRSVESCPTCAEPSCDIPVERAGDLCLQHHGLPVCPKCKRACLTYEDQEFVERGGNWFLASACCDAKLRDLGPVRARYWGMP